METYEQIKAERDFYKGIYEDQKCKIRAMIVSAEHMKWNRGWRDFDYAMWSYLNFCDLAKKIRPMTAFALMWHNLGNVMYKKYGMM